VKTVVIHQPDFIPWLGFFDRLLQADLFVALDSVQFVHSNRSWTHRDKIKTGQGERWITVSVKKPSRTTAINEVLLAEDTSWRQDNLNLIAANYKSAPFFDEIFPAVRELYKRPDALLADFTLSSIDMLMDMLAIRVPVVRSGTLGASGAKSELLVDILQRVGATHYLSGVGARAYLDSSLFEAKGIEVRWQEFTHPVYPQLHGAFIPMLTTLDMLFNCGIARSRSILRGT
jgi:hypothetical protein